MHCVYVAQFSDNNSTSAHALFQGNILQHAGNFSAVAALADEARSMDLADRYLNSECVMQMLQGM